MGTVISLPSRGRSVLPDDAPWIPGSAQKTPTGSDVRDEREPGAHYLSLVVKHPARLAAQ